MAAIPGFGDPVALFDLGIRVGSFINDLRHAQDDFLGLRAEADCLRICINSLNSPQNLDVLYHYISDKQGVDLKSIVTNCKLNMVDLNKFIASSAKIVEDHVGMPNRPGRRKKGWRALLAKGWATYKFTMTDKQAFRDKLVLPTASINVFLTSLTHVGLANMGKVMVLSGHLPVNSGQITWPGPANIPAINTQGSGALVKANEIIGWKVVGRSLAVKARVVDEDDLTDRIEQEVIEYLKYLVAGGDPFFVRSPDEDLPGGSIEIMKKTTLTERSKSRDRGPTTLGKEAKSGKLYLKRKKSVSKPAEKIEIVERDYISSPGRNGRDQFLALPAPDPDGTLSNDDYARSPLDADYIERWPGGRSGRDAEQNLPYRNSFNDHGLGFGGHNDSGGVPVGDFGGTDGIPARAYDDGRAQGSGDNIPPYYPDQNFPLRGESHTGRTYSEDELRARRNHVRQLISREKQDATREIDRVQQTSRSRREDSQVYGSMSAQRRSRVEANEDVEEAMDFLEREYGVTVTRVDKPRPCIDNGKVADLAPPITGNPYQSRYQSDSEESDTPIPPDLVRPDRLRAETSLPYSGRRNDRSYSSGRFEPYDPSESARLRRRHPRYYDPGDEGPPSPPLPPPIVLDNMDPNMETGFRTTHHRQPYMDDDLESRSYSPDGEREIHMADELYISRPQESRQQERRRRPHRNQIIIQEPVDPLHHEERRRSYGGMDAPHNAHPGPIRHGHSGRRRNTDFSRTGDVFMHGALRPHDEENEGDDYESRG